MQEEQNSMRQTQVIEDLESISPHQRMTAVSRILKENIYVPTPILVKSLQNESTPPIIAALNRILKKQENKSNFISDSSKETSWNSEKLSQTDRLYEDIHQKRTDSLISKGLSAGEISGRLRHEILPYIGSLEIAAYDEINSYDTSETHKFIKLLKEAIYNLPVIFDDSPEEEQVLFSEVIDRSLNFPEAKKITRIEFPDFSLRVNSTLLEVLISNIFRNALDAANESPDFLLKYEVWTIGNSFGLKVTNSFKGSKISKNHLSGVGSTSKKYHSGRGISLIEEISNRLSLKFDLSGNSGIAESTLTGVIR